MFRIELYTNTWIIIVSLLLCLIQCGNMYKDLQHILLVFTEFINMFNFDNVFCSVFIWKRFTKRMFECYRGASFPLKCLFLYTVYCLPKSYNQLVLLLSYNQYLFAPFNSFINKVWSKVKVFLVFLAFCDCSIARQSSFYLGYPKRNVSTVYVWPNRFC